MNNFLQHFIVGWPKKRQDWIGYLFMDTYNIQWISQQLAWLFDTIYFLFCFNFCETYYLFNRFSSFKLRLEYTYC